MITTWIFGFWSLFFVTRYVCYVCLFHSTSLGWNSCRDFVSTVARTEPFRYIRTELMLNFPNLTVWKPSKKRCICCEATFSRLIISFGLRLKINCSFRLSWNIWNQLSSKQNLRKANNWIRQYCPNVSSLIEFIWKGDASCKRNWVPCDKEYYFQSSAADADVSNHVWRMALQVM